MHISLPSPALIVGLIALAVALSGVAYAVTPGGGEQIHGCYQKSKGDLRVAESETTCRESELSITWNQQGVQGPPGPVGPQGPPGEAASGRVSQMVVADDQRQTVLALDRLGRIDLRCDADGDQGGNLFFWVNDTAEHVLMTRGHVTGLGVYPPGAAVEDSWEVDAWLLAPQGDDTYASTVRAYQVETNGSSADSDCIAVAVEDVVRAEE